MMNLPRHPDRSAETDRSKADHSSPRSDSHRMEAAPEILIADDNQSTKWALEQLFEDSGYRVEAASDGSEMLDRLEPVILGEPNTHPPDLIVTDVRMPGIDVFSIVDQLREVGWSTPIIVVTGFGTDRIRHRVHRLGRALYFEKPVDIELLEETAGKLTG